MNTKLLFFVLFISSTTLAQVGTIKGTIYLSDSITPISGVTVSLDRTNLTDMTNAEGIFEFSGLSAVDFFVVINHPGYKKIKESVDLTNGGSVTLRFYLKEEVTDLPEAVVRHVTLTGGEKGIKDLPGSAYYLSPKELEKFNYSDVNRMLKSVPGVNIQEEDGFGLRPNIGLRGTGVERSSKITVMEDGVLIAPAPYSAPAAYYFPTIGRMQAVEILKGSSQIKYGPYTTGGAINMISSQIPSDLKAKFTMLGGSFNGRNLHAFIGNSHKYVGYSVEAFNYSSDGFKTLDNGGSTGFDKKDVIAKLRFNTPSDARIYQSLTLKAGMSTERSDDTYLGITADDFATTPFRRYASSQMDEMNTDQSQLTATYVLKPNKLITFTTTAYRMDFHRNWYKLDAVKDTSGVKRSIASILDNPNEYVSYYDIIAGGTSLNDDALYVKANNRTYSAQGIQSVVGFDLKTGKIEHDIDLGFRYHQDNMDRYQLEDKYKMVNGTMMLTAAGTPGTESNRIVHAIAAASYLQYKMNMKRFSTTLGIRHEQIWLSEKDFGKSDPGRTGTALSTKSNEVNVFIPGISVDYKINELMSAFAGVHKGFAPPGVNEGSTPEESVNYEAGAKLYRKALSSQLVIFFNDYSNLLGADLAAGGGMGTGVLFNGGSARSQGIEFQLIYDLLSKIGSGDKKNKFNLPLIIGYTYTDAYFRTDFESTFEDWGTVSSGDKLPYLANNQFSFNLTLEHAKFSLSLGGKYTSDMRTVAGSDEIPSNELIPSTFILDAGAKYHVVRNVSLVCNVINLTNETYLVSTRPAGLRPGMPFAIQAGLKATF
jgi:Fe(3+) dicitrate transport protein